MKKRLLFALSLLLVASMVLSACAPAATPTEAAAQFTCALITPNPLGDRSFIDASARGIERANAELPVKCDIIESSGVAENETALRGAIAQDYDLILGLAMDPEMFIGLVEEFHPRTESIVFSKGDTILLYTDGVTEVMDTGNHEFGQERLAEVLRQNGDLTAPNMLQVLRQGMGVFGDNRPLVDDVTMIALKISE